MTSEQAYNMVREYQVKGVDKGFQVPDEDTRQMLSKALVMLFEENSGVYTRHIEVLAR